MLAVLSACQQGGTTAEKKDTTITAAPVDSVKLLEDEVMDIHNVGMAKMIAIRHLKQQLDSTIAAAKKTGKPVTAFQEQQKSLDVANNAMNNWMHAYDMELEGKDEAAKKAYLYAERSKITAVRDTMLTAIEGAEKALNIKP